jgi:YesN/AraC family two-component response regulator
MHSSKKETLGKLNLTPIPFHELVLVFEGKLDYTLDGEEISLEAKDAAYIPMGCVRARAEALQHTDYLSIHFLSDNPLPFPKKLPNVIHGCIPNLINITDYIYRKFPINTALSLISQLIHFLIEYIQADLSLPKDSKYVKKMKEYMHNHIYSPFQVKDLAGELFLSPSYCHACFKKETGTPIMTYFNNLRLQEAKNLLALGEITPTEIVEMLCFYDYNYFSRMFKKAS